ncbi:hypothetical protein ScPMuIL_010384 [Solemya velum]
MPGKRKFIIDTDAGIDDAQAIFMALGADDVDVIAITVVHGNTNAPQVARNVLRILKVAGRMEIPLYLGCDSPFLGDKRPPADYHGSDGFGDAPDTSPPDESLIQEEHSTQALSRLSKEYKGEITLLCLGPLTNIATTIRMDPEFGKRLKNCVIMGGNYHGKGNVTVSAEFNFYADPEGAYVVLNQLGCDITMVCWELCDEHSLPWDIYHRLRAADTSIARFMRAIEEKPMKKCFEEKWPLYVPCDELATAVALWDDVIKSHVHVYATVELAGKLTWGQMVVDWQGILNKPKNVKIITDINHERYRPYLFQTYGIEYTAK